MPSDLWRNLNTSNNRNIHFEQGGKILGQDSTRIGFHAPQWRDVPSKVRKAVCDATSLDQTSTGLDREGRDDFQLGNISVKRPKRTTDMGDLSKEKENSNVSSGCSAPLVTQASVMVNKIDYCTDDAVDTGFVNNLVVDEGSGIDQVSLSDLVESERTDELLGLISGNYMKNGCSRVLNDESCCNLRDDLKLLDSLIWKKERNQNHFVVSANCKTNQSHNVKRGIKGRKRKRNVVRILDASLSSEFPSLLPNKNDEGAEILHSSSSLPNEMQMHSLSSLQKSFNKSSFVQPCNKRIQSAFSSKFNSCKNSLRKHLSYKVAHESQSDSYAEFRTLPGVSGTKKLRNNLTSDCFEQFHMQEPSYEEPKKAELWPFLCRKENGHRITRPVVCGKYGEIRNGHLAKEVQKPAKIVSLNKVLKSSKRCMSYTKGKPRLTSKKKWKRLSIGTDSEYCCGNRGLKVKEHIETQNTIIYNEASVDMSLEDLERGGKQDAKAKAKQGVRVGNRENVLLKVKNKDIRKHRSINELTAKGEFEQSFVIIFLNNVFGKLIKKN